MSDSLTIPARYRGFEGSINGGYACGVLAGLLGGPTEGVLRKPVPFDRALAIERPDHDHVRLLDRENLVAEGARAELAIDVPEPISYEDAERAGASYVWRERHPAPECFVCGPDRAAGDGLRIFPGAVRGLAAASWAPDPSVCDEDGLARPEIVWAALDCPSWFGAYLFTPEIGVGLLGTLTGEIVRRPREGEPCVAIGWRTAAAEGRKVPVGSAILDAEGRVLARARALWILVER